MIECVYFNLELTCCGGRYGLPLQGCLRQAQDAQGSGRPGADSGWQREAAACTSDVTVCRTCPLRRPQQPAVMRLETGLPRRASQTRTSRHELGKKMHHVQTATPQGTHKPQARSQCGVRGADGTPSCADFLVCASTTTPEFPTKVGFFVLLIWLRGGLGRGVKVPWNCCG